MSTVTSRAPPATKNRITDRIAARLDWDEIAPAEVLAVASLQADVLVTDDPVLAAAAEGVVERMPWDAFVRALG